MKTFMYFAEHFVNIALTSIVFYFCLVGWVGIIGFIGFDLVLKPFSWICSFIISASVLTALVIAGYRTFCKYLDQ